MRSRAARLVIGAIAWIAFCAGAFLLLETERLATERRAASQSFDTTAHDVAAALADIRVAQHAYLAEGQDVALWRPRLDALVKAAGGGLDRLARSTTSAGALAALSEALAETRRLSQIDQDARAAVSSGDRALAADLVLAQGGRSAVSAARLIDRARAEERREAALSEAAARREQALTLLGATIIASFVILLLVLSPAARAVTDEAPGLHLQDLRPPAQNVTADLSLRAPTPDVAPASKVVTRQAIDPSPQLLAEASEVCTAFSRARDSGERTTALQRAARLMKANGMIVWLGDAAGAPLRPVFAHGYSAQVLARLPAIPRSSETAVAAAYRSGSLQTVAAEAGQASSALVAPLFAADACIGALTVEMPAGEEQTPAAGPLAALFAAQFATFLAPSAAAEHVSGNSAASASA